MTVAKQAVCPVCSGGQVRRVITANLHHQLYGCDICAHVFVTITDLKEDENRQVQLQHFGESFAARKGYFIAFYERINAKRTARALGEGKGKRVLEIGPGSGAVMAWLAMLGHEVQGLDMSSAVARQVERRWKLPVTVESLSAHVQAVGLETYDMIVMRHVLEHFNDPCEALRDVHALLKPGGRLYVAVPNMDSWHSRFRGWSGYEPYHVHYFGQQSLAMALKRTDYQVVSMESYESLTGWTNTILRSLAKRTSSKEQAEVSRADWKRKALESARLVFGWILSPLRWVQSALGRGEELIAVAEKVSR